MSSDTTKDNFCLGCGEKKSICGCEQQLQPPERASCLPTCILKPGHEGFCEYAKGEQPVSLKEVKLVCGNGHEIDSEHIAAFKEACLSARQRAKPEQPSLAREWLDENYPNWEEGLKPMAVSWPTILQEFRSRQLEQAQQRIAQWETEAQKLCGNGLEGLLAGYEQAADIIGQRNGRIVELEQRIAELDKDLKDQLNCTAQLESNIRFLNERVERESKEREQAEAKVAELESKIPHAGDGSCDHCGNIPAIVLPTSLCDDCVQGIRRAEQAEAERERLRDALEALYRGAKAYMGCKPWRCADEDLARAEAALAGKGE